MAGRICPFKVTLARIAPRDAIKISGGAVGTVAADSKQLKLSDLLVEEPRVLHMQSGTDLAVPKARTVLGKFQVRGEEGTPVTAFSVLQQNMAASPRFIGVLFCFFLPGCYKAEEFRCSVSTRKTPSCYQRE